MRLYNPALLIHDKYSRSKRRMINIGIAADKQKIYFSQPRALISSWEIGKNSFIRIYGLRYYFLYSLMTTPSTFSAGAGFPLTAICIALMLPYFTIIFLSAEKFFSWLLTKVPSKTFSPSTVTSTQICHYKTYRDLDCFYQEQLAASAVLAYCQQAFSVL